MLLPLPFAIAPTICPEVARSCWAMMTLRISCCIMSYALKVAAYIIRCSANFAQRSLPLTPNAWRLRKIIPLLVSSSMVRGDAWAYSWHAPIELVDAEEIVASGRVALEPPPPGGPPPTMREGQLLRQAQPARASCRRPHRAPAASTAAPWPTPEERPTGHRVGAACSRRRARHWRCR